MQCSKTVPTALTIVITCCGIRLRNLCRRWKPLGTRSPKRRNDRYLVVGAYTGDPGRGETIARCRPPATSNRFVPGPKKKIAEAGSICTFAGAGWSLEIHAGGTGAEGYRVRIGGHCELMGGESGSCLLMR